MSEPYEKMLFGFIKKTCGIFNTFLFHSFMSATYEQSSEAKLIYCKAKTMISKKKSL